MRTGRLVALVCVLLAAQLFAGGRARAAAADGNRLYRRYCANCHGADGRGDGPDAAIFSRPPRDLRSGFLNRYPTEELVQRVREGKPLELAFDLPALRARAGEVEAVVAYLKHLPAVNWKLAAPGRDLYATRCALCHGAFGKPGAAQPAGVRTPRDLSDPAVQRSLSDRELVVLVRHGREGMPALIPRVPESAGPSLVAFVRLLSPGFVIYDTYCANCHGDDGRGVHTNGRELQAPKVVFDGAYFARRDPEELRGSVWHMIGEQQPKMPHHRWALDEAQARAIIEYLKHGQ